jgi:hypothetical protein
MFTEQRNEQRLENHMSQSIPKNIPLTGESPSAPLFGSAFSVRDEITRLIKRTNEADPDRKSARVQGYRDALLLCRRLVRKEFKL